MNYTYKIALDPGVYTQVRAILGVTAKEFTDEELDLLPMLPAAEREVIKLVPTYATLLSNADRKFELEMAVIYFAAENALPSLRFKLLEVETDNKSTAQRFRSALDKATQYLTKGMKYIQDINDSLGTVASSKAIFERSAPTFNPVTGTGV